ncbi:aminotransferase-like domain-containing protein [Kineococcus sp. NUM-3379]
MPSSCDLTAEPGISRTTVVAALDDLIAEGVLTARGRSGLHVARHAAPVGDGPLRAGAAQPPDGVERVAGPFDLRPGQPEQGSFPTSRWVSALRRAATRSNPTSGPADGAGAQVLCTQLAAYLARVRGVHADPDRIVISAGFRAACTAQAVTTTDLGVRQVAMEDPCLPAVVEPWRRLGHAVLDLPVDADGGRVEDLENLTTVAGCAPGVVVLTSSHQLPLGGALRPRRRRLVCDWATRTGGYVIEDDYDGEFRFGRRPVTALQRSAPNASSTAVVPARRCHRTCGSAGSSCPRSWSPPPPTRSASSQVAYRC